MPKLYSLKVKIPTGIFPDSSWYGIFPTEDLSHRDKLKKKNEEKKTARSNRSETNASLVEAVRAGLAMLKITNFKKVNFGIENIDVDLLFQRLQLELKDFLKVKLKYCKRTPCKFKNDGTEIFIRVVHPEELEQNRNNTYIEGFRNINYKNMSMSDDWVCDAKMRLFSSKSNPTERLSKGSINYILDSDSKALYKDQHIIPMLTQKVDLDKRAKVIIKGKPKILHSMNELYKSFFSNYYVDINPYLRTKREHAVIVSHLRELKLLTNKKDRTENKAKEINDKEKKRKKLKLQLTAMLQPIRSKFNRFFSEIAIEKCNRPTKKLVPSIYMEGTNRCTYYQNKCLDKEKVDKHYGDIFGKCKTIYYNDRVHKHDYKNKGTTVEVSLANNVGRTMYDLGTLNKYYENTDTFLVKFATSLQGSEMLQLPNNTVETDPNKFEHNLTNVVSFEEWKKKKEARTRSRK